MDSIVYTEFNLYDETIQKQIFYLTFDYDKRDIVIHYKMNYTVCLRCLCIQNYNARQFYLSAMHFIRSKVFYRQNKQAL